jgi:hypothetical protein
MEATARDGKERGVALHLLGDALCTVGEREREAKVWRRRLTISLSEKPRTLGTLGAIFIVACLSLVLFLPSSGLL